MVDLSIFQGEQPLPQFATGAVKQWDHDRNNNEMPWTTRLTATKAQAKLVTEVRQGPR
jgi:hypothetical protein